MNGMFFSVALLLIVPGIAVAGECPIDWSKAIVYLPKVVESPEAVKLFLGKGSRVTTETAAREEMQRLKNDSYKACQDEKCQIELGQAVSASHMVQKAEDGSLYIWDLRTEAIVCTVTIPAPSPVPSGKGENLTVQKIIDGTLLAKDMTVMKVLELLGPPDSKSVGRGGFTLTYSNDICVRKTKAMRETCNLVFQNGALAECNGTKFGVCPFDITQN